MFLMFIKIPIFSATILCLMEGDVWERGTMFPNQVDLTRERWTCIVPNTLLYSTHNIFYTTHFIVTNALYSTVRIVYFLMSAIL